MKVFFQHFGNKQILENVRERFPDLTRNLMMNRYEFTVPKEIENVVKEFPHYSIEKGLFYRIENQLIGKGMAANGVEEQKFESVFIYESGEVYRTGNIQRAVVGQVR